MKKTVFFLLVLSALLLFVSCGNTTTEVTTEEAVTTADTPVTTTTAPTTTTPTTTTVPVTTTTPITTEDPDDAWKEKVVWGYDEDYPTDAYDEETGKYTIAIFVQDVHNIGQKEAEAAFAKKYSLDYDPENSLWEILDLCFRVYVTKDEIEMYARLEEVKQIRFVYRGYNE